MLKHQEICTMGIQKQTVIIIALSVLLVGAFFYIMMEKYNAHRQEKDSLIFQGGAQYGYEQAIIQMAQMAKTCEQVPLNIQNQTISMIAVQCLKQ